MNGVATFRKCSLSNDELIKRADGMIDSLYNENADRHKILSRHIPARPDEDFDLVLGEVLLRLRDAGSVKKLQDLMDWNHDFAKRVFPKHCEDPRAPLYHLNKEVTEIIDSIDDDKPREEILEEYADAMILLSGSAIRLGFTAEELLDASHKKMKKNEDRDWGEPDENGVYSHIKKS